LSAEEQTSSPNENTPPSTRIEDILLDRLQNEPKIAPQISRPILFIIIIVILGLGTGIYFFTRLPDKFAANPHQPQEQETASDSSAMYSKRMKLQPMIDSLQGVLAQNPSDDESHLALANVLYECEFWNKARTEYETYLKNHPDDPDARVDYAYVLVQITGDFKASVKEIDKALKYDPEHVNALFNAGILTIRADMNDRKKAVADATPYFKRALAAAKKQGNDKMAEQIGKVMDELEKLKEDGPVK
jgi:cytochrome c-type biogenesis protein CcmH/NrfG